MKHNEFNTFLKPDFPFLLHYSIMREYEEFGWKWFKSENELISVINEMRKTSGDKFHIEDVMEVGSVREIEVSE